VIFVGIDVGARTLHCVALDASGRIAAQDALSAGDLAALVSWCRGASVVAIDAPEAPSACPHADDHSLAPKFRHARCAEIELGRRHGSWVSCVAPPEPPFPGWIATGFAVYRALRPLGAELLEVYPYAGFRHLAGGRRLARKQTAAGAHERTRLLGRAGAELATRSHDLIDALLAASLARDRAHDRAKRVTCGHDGLVI